jgi:DNA-binding MarR family transcriptional regulator
MIEYINNLTDKQREYLRRVRNELRYELEHKDLYQLTKLEYGVEMEFINRVLGDLYYTDEDKSRLNGLKKYIKG